jgi:hypothetical protein
MTILEWNRPRLACPPPPTVRRPMGRVRSLDISDDSLLFPSRSAETCRQQQAAINLIDRRTQDEANNARTPQDPSTDALPVGIPTSQYYRCGLFTKY